MTERVLQMNSTQGATGPLEAQVKELRELVDRSLSGATSMQVAALEAKIRLLEARLPSTLAGRLGGESFQSRADVNLFVEKHIPSNSFYLFHDAVTLLESLTNAHMERKDVLPEWYQSTKVGVKEAAARNMASFSLMLPTVFGKLKEGDSLTSKHPLPAIKSFKEWNTFDGVSGVKGYITLGMDDLKYQLRQDIEQAFGTDGLIKARILALKCMRCHRTLSWSVVHGWMFFYQE